MNERPQDCHPWYLGLRRVQHQALFYKTVKHISQPKLSSCWMKNINLPHTLTISMRRCATCRKVMGSIPDGVTGIFHWHNPSSRTMALGLTQPLTELSTRNISCRVKVAGTWGWQPYHLHVPSVLKSGSLNPLEPSGPVQVCNGTVLP